MRGASTVNEEFEVGFNQNFESYWYIAEQIGRVIMVLFAAISALGLLGRGPFSHATIQSPTGAISVDYEPVARHGTTTMVSVHVKRSQQTPEPVELWVSQRMIEPMGYQRSIPLADTSRISDDGMRLTFLPLDDSPEVLVRFELMPSAVGIIPLQVSEGSDTVNWSLLVVP
jgi:hypothetical protein